jgi:hypothetical protein
MRTYSPTMKSYSQEELHLFADALQKVLPQGAIFLLVVCEPGKCSAVCTANPEAAPELQAAMAELSQRKPYFSN